MNIVLSGILLLVLIFLSGFFSSSETAFMSLSKITLRNLLKNPRKKNSAKLIASLKQKQELLLTTILVGNNLVNNFASSLATAFAISLVGESGIGIATVVMTFLIITFGEIIPKTLAQYKPVEFAFLLAKPIRCIQIILYPVSFVFAKFTKALSFLLAKCAKNNEPLVTEEELKTLIDLGRQEGTLETGEQEMMHKIFEFTDLHVRDCMTKRAVVKGICKNASYIEAVEAFASCGKSRIPVYEDNFDNVCGVLFYRELLFHKEEGNKDFIIEERMASPLFVPETMMLVQLLSIFKAKKVRFAVAVDEHGCNSGIITMKDALSAVFGRINGEFGALEQVPAEERITFINQKEICVPGDLLLSDCNAIFSFNLESEYYQTIAGWLLEQFGTLPQVGELIRTDKAVFIVEQQFQRCIKQIRIKLLDND